MAIVLPMKPIWQVPYKGRTLSGDELNLQIHSWLQRGVIDARTGGMAAMMAGVERKTSNEPLVIEHSYG